MRSGGACLVAGLLPDAVVGAAGLAAAGVAMVLAPLTVECMPEDLRRWPMISLAAGLDTGASEQAALAEPVAAHAGAMFSK